MINQINQYMMLQVFIIKKNLYQTIVFKLKKLKKNKNCGFRKNQFKYIKL